MTSPVLTLPADATMRDARIRFAAGGHGAYPIVDGTRVVGILSRGDLLLNANADDAPILPEATRMVVTVLPSDSAQTALQVMIDEQIDHVPVVDEDGDLVGIFTRADLVKVRQIHSELEQVQPSGITPPPAFP